MWLLLPAVAKKTSILIFGIGLAGELVRDVGWSVDGSALVSVLCQ